MTTIDVDVVIAGGGIAGFAAAASLQEFGWSTLVVEPGQHAERRLAGELIHPPGMAGLVDLKLCGNDGLPGAVAIRGFQVFREEGGRAVELPYDLDSQSGLPGNALEHGMIRSGLAAAAASLPKVALWRGARITDVNASSLHDVAQVTITSAGKKETVACRMVVGADGASSAIRRLAGIGHSRRDLSHITGYRVDAAALPARGFGHIFMTRKAPVLAYEIGGGQARVMFDHLISSGETPADHRLHASARLPTALRAAVDEAVATQRGLGFVSADVFVDAVGKGRLLLVGDAAGSCHPLTASGITVAIGDAQRLRQALDDSGGEAVRAIELYARRRCASQRARRLLASAVHEACGREDRAARLIRDGLIDYWELDARGRKASMALLTMSDSRILAIVREMASLLMIGLRRTYPRAQPLGHRLIEGTRLTAALSALLLRHVSTIAKAR
jgi:squalene monooxygenase